LIESSGKRWKQIATALKPFDRTPAMVRNRYLRIKRGRWLTEQGQSKNRCGICGELKRGHVCRLSLAQGPPPQVETGRDNDDTLSSSSTDLLENVALVVSTPARDVTFLPAPVADEEEEEEGDDDSPPPAETTPPKPTRPTPLVSGSPHVDSPVVKVATAVKPPRVMCLRAEGGGPTKLERQGSLEVLAVAASLVSNSPQCSPRALAPSPCIVPSPFA